MQKAIWEGVVLAESDDCAEVEGNQFFPPESVQRQFLKPSDHTSLCPWKGVASYYHVEVNGKTKLQRGVVLPRTQGRRAADQGADRILERSDGGRLIRNRKTTNALLRSL